MTKDEFIDGYMQRSRIDPKYRTDTGYEINGRKELAVKCDCDYDGCKGFAMISEEEYQRGLDEPVCRTYELA